MLEDNYGEANIETLPHNIFVFANKVLNKNYINISVDVYCKFWSDALSTHTFP